MSLHPYPFKWRVFRRFAGVLVMILRQLRNAQELDIKISRFASDVGNLKGEMDSIKNELKKIGVDPKDKKKKTGQAKLLQKRIDKKVRKVRSEVNSFCRSVKEELMDFMKIKIDSDTLHYRETRYLRHLAEMLLRSKKINVKAKETLKRGIEQEMLSLQRKASSLELQAKHLERGGINTVVFSEISPWGNRWIERRIKIRAIEVNALHKRLQSDSPLDLFKDFEKEAANIYDISNNVNILIRRLNSTFNSMKGKIREMGLYFPALNETERFFRKSRTKIERMGKWLDNEIKDQAGEAASDLRRAA